MLSSSCEFNHNASNRRFLKATSIDCTFVLETLGGRTSVLDGLWLTDTSACYNHLVSSTGISICHSSSCEFDGYIGMLSGMANKNVVISHPLLNEGNCIREYSTISQFDTLLWNHLNFHSKLGLIVEYSRMKFPSFSSGCEITTFLVRYMDAITILWFRQTHRHATNILCVGETHHHLVSSTYTSTCYHHLLSSTDTSACYHHLVRSTDISACYHHLVTPKSWVGQTHHHAIIIL